MNYSKLNDNFINDLGDFYKIFGDTNRLKILFILFEKELTVSEICDELNLNQSLVSHQLRILRQNDLVKYKRSGKNVIYSLDDYHIFNLVKEGVEHLKHKRGDYSE